MDVNYPNRIFEIKESVVSFCQECNSKFENPSVVYCLEEDNGKICCISCASIYEDKELKLFVDMNDNPKVKIIKERDKRPLGSY